jgi:hypothetical protein
VRAKATMQETSEETLARYGASTAGATTSAAASKSTAQLWLDAGMRDVAHLIGVVWLALAQQTLLPVKVCMRGGSGHISRPPPVAQS